LAKNLLAPKMLIMMWLQIQEGVRRRTLATVEQVGGRIVSMKTGQKPSLNKTMSAILGCALVAGISSISVGSGTFIVLATTMSALILSRSALIERAGGQLKPCKVSTASNR
jgi:hypothetical protein